jgi:hypothetical protein
VALVVLAGVELLEELDEALVGTVAVGIVCADEELRGAEVRCGVREAPRSFGRLGQREHLALPVGEIANSRRDLAPILGACTRQEAVELEVESQVLVEALVAEREGELHGRFLFAGSIPRRPRSAEEGSGGTGTGPKPGTRWRGGSSAAL